MLQRIERGRKFSNQKHHWRWNDSKLGSFLCKFGIVIVPVRCTSTQTWIALLIGWYKIYSYGSNKKVQLSRVNIFSPVCQPSSDPNTPFESQEESRFPQRNKFKKILEYRENVTLFTVVTAGRNFQLLYQIHTPFENENRIDFHTWNKFEVTIRQCLRANVAKVWAKLEMVKISLPSFLCEVSRSGGSNHDGIFFISRNKPNLVSGGEEVHGQKCFFLCFNPWKLTFC